jgi:hypothetical protein
LTGGVGIKQTFFFLAWVHPGASQAVEPLALRRLMKSLLTSKRTWQTQWSRMASFRRSPVSSTKTPTENEIDFVRCSLPRPSIQRRIETV